MSDTTPNSLEPTKKVDAARMSKWPLYAAGRVVPARHSGLQRELCP